MKLVSIFTVTLILCFVHMQKWQRKWFSLESSGDLNFFDNEKVSREGGRVSGKEGGREEGGRGDK